MPMMRRGPLDRYPAEWTLRQAHAHQASGSLEFHTTRPITIYLDGGRITHAVEGVPATGLPEPDDEVVLEEADARRMTVALLATVLDASSGWYYHDPLGTHDDAGRWRWEPAQMVRDAHVRKNGTEAANRAPAPAPTPDLSVVDITEAPLPEAASPQLVELAPRTTADGPVTIGGDAWAVVAALARRTDAAVLADQLGWPSQRLADALEVLRFAGAISGPHRPPSIAATPSTVVAPDAPAAAELVPAAAMPPPPPPVHEPVAAPVPDETPPAEAPAPVEPIAARASGEVPSDDRRGALRRLISVLRPA